VSQLKLEVNASSRREAREKVSEQVTIGFGFTSDWRKFLKPIVVGKKTN